MRPSRRPRHRRAGRALPGRSVRGAGLGGRVVVGIALTVALASGVGGAAAVPGGPVGPAAARAAPASARAAPASPVTPGADDRRPVERPTVERPTAERPTAERPIAADRAAAADGARWTAAARAGSERVVRESRALAAAALAAAAALDPLRIAPDPLRSLADLDAAVVGLRSATAALGSSSARVVVPDRDASTVAHPVAGVEAVPVAVVVPAGPGTARVPVRTVPGRVAASQDVRAAAAEVFRLSAVVERQGPGAESRRAVPDHAGLVDLERSAAAAARLAGLLGAPDVRRSAGVTPGLLRPDGTVDPAVLCAVPFAPGARLRCDAVGALVRLDEVFRAEHGTDLPVGDAYRSFDQQVAVRGAKGDLAAPPGTSHHGWGVAVDFRGFGGVGDFDQPLYRWMVVHGPGYGWVHPEGMGPGGSGPLEPWHWEFAGAPLGRDPAGRR